MTRRAVVAAAAAFLLKRTPTHAAVCPPPFVREGDPLAIALKGDLHRWALTNEGVDATVLLMPQLSYLIASIGVQGVYVDGNNRYELQVMPQLPPSVPWVIVPACMEVA